jgi:hypothetical protein
MDNKFDKMIDLLVFNSQYVKHFIFFMLLIPLYVHLFSAYLALQTINDFEKARMIKTNSSNPVIMELPQTGDDSDEISNLARQTVIGCNELVNDRTLKSNVMIYNNSDREVIYYIFGVGGYKQSIVMKSGISNAEIEVLNLDSYTWEVYYVDDYNNMIATGIIDVKTNCENVRNLFEDMI